MAAGNSEDRNRNQNRTFSLIIQNPDPEQEDRTVEGLSPDWTVRDLKTHLAAVYPTTPAVREQYLIYGGKLLPDHLHLKDLLSWEDSVPSLDLVCSIRNRRRGQTGLKVGDEVESQLNQRTSSSSSPPRYEPPKMSPPSFPTYSLYSAQQLLWLQHVYARQFYMQYHAALAAAGSTHTTAPAHRVPVPVQVPAQVPVQVQIPANGNPAAQDGGLMDQNLRMNAQGGPLMEDEEEAERDWLDRMYSAARFSVLLAIVYFNSNLSRFLLVMSTLLLMYLHTAGWFPFRRRVQVQEPENNQNQQNQNQDGEPNDRRQADGPDSPEAPGAPLTAVLVPPHRVSVMWTAWVFFKTFFSSLIPEVPQVN